MYLAEYHQLNQARFQDELFLAFPNWQHQFHMNPGPRFQLIFRFLFCHDLHYLSHWLTVPELDVEICPAQRLSPFKMACRATHSAPSSMR